MPIYFNNGSNPHAVSYNSSYVDYVNYNDTRVWSAVDPSTVSVIRAWSSPGGAYDIYLRNAVLSSVSYTIDSRTGKITKHVKYSSDDCSFDLGWRQYVWTGYMHPTNDVSDMFVQSFYDSSSSVSGMPSGFKYDSWTATSSEVLDLDVKYSPNSGGAISTFPTMQVGFKILYVDDEVSSGGEPHVRLSAVSTSKTTDVDLYTYAATNGIVFQGPGEITFDREVSSFDE